MKINKVKLMNFAGAIGIECELKSRISLFHGFNAQGKSYTLSGIRTAITGEFKELKKKDFNLLLTEGKSKGLCEVEADTGKMSFRIPSGVHDNPNKNKYDKYVTNTYEILKEKEFSEFVFNLCNTELDFVKLSEYLERKCLYHKENIDPICSAGNIDNSRLLIESTLTNLRIAWREITGDVYGCEKAESWDSDKNDQSLIDLRSITEREPELKDDLNKKEKSLEAAIKSRQDFRKLYEDILLKKSTSGKLTCCLCGAIHGISDGKLVEFNGEEVSDTQIDERKKSFEVSVNAVKSIEQQIQSIKIELSKCEYAFARIKKIHEGSDDSTKKAHEIHSQIKEWVALKDELSPEGYPNTLLVESINKLNNILCELNSKMINGVSKWPRLYFNRSCELVVNGLGYPEQGTRVSLLSKSDQWKVSVILTAAISKISGLNYMLIDEVDILNPSDRGKFFSWLNKCEFDSVICAMTAKEKLDKKPDWMDIFWIENGVVA